MQPLFFTKIKNISRSFYELFPYSNHIFPIFRQKLGNYTTSWVRYYSIRIWESQGKDVPVSAHPDFFGNCTAKLPRRQVISVILMVRFRDIHIPIYRSVER